MQQTELSLTGRLRLELLQELLPTLHSWMETIGELRAEAAEQTKLLAEAATICDTAILQVLDDACEQANRALKDAQGAADSRRPPPNAGAPAAHEPHVAALLT